VEPQPATPPAQPVRVLFIAGLGRSGSTLLDRILGQVPGCCNIGEASQTWRNMLRGVRCGCGERPQQCPFWTAVVASAFGGWAEFDAGRVLAMQLAVDRTRFLPLLMGPCRPASFTSRLAAYAEQLGAFYRAVAQVSGARVIVDSGKHTSTAYLLRHLPGVDLRVVHLVRDPRGVAYSWSKVLDKSPYADGGEMDRLPPGATARSWLFHNLLLSGLTVAGVPSRMLRYEDFVAAPAERLREIAEFVGLSAQAAAVPFLADTAVEFGKPDHTLAGNPLRFRDGRVAIRADEAWRDLLPARDRRLVEVVTAPLLLAYDYCLPAPRRSPGAVFDADSAGKPL
jgi:Sulfotransferase family